jgi:hypothetical protein
VNKQKSVALLKATLEGFVPYFSQARFIIESMPKSYIRTASVVATTFGVAAWFYF